MKTFEVLTLTLSGWGSFSAFSGNKKSPPALKYYNKRS
ncbi:hypothetical protein [Corynebacterium phage IME1320_01]|nr:hypothetical protein [Corynebacterium phage IME1320_01]